MNFQLSIIIPHYNSIDSLKKLLSTIPDNPNIQVIVVDDHSPDPVKEEYFRLSKEFDADRYLFLENASSVHNAGAARNIGLNHAKGEWLLFADSDDFFLDGFYDAVSEYFEQDYDIIFFKTTSIYVDNGELANRHIYWNRRITDYLTNPCRRTEIRLRTRFNVPFAKLIRSRIIDENGIEFDETPVANDTFFSAKVGYYARKITASDKIIYCITRARGSLTTKLDLETFETRASVQIRVNNFWRENMARSDYAYIGKFTAYEYLYTIIKRKYGIKVFMKYVRIFAQNHMFAVSLKGLRRGMFSSFLNTNREEREVKDSYQKNS